MSRAIGILEYMKELPLKLQFWAGLVRLISHFPNVHQNGGQGDLVEDETQHALFGLGFPKLGALAMLGKSKLKRRDLANLATGE